MRRPPEGSMAAFLKGAEFGCAMAAVVAVVVGEHHAVLASIAAAAYCRYVRSGS